jgi:hypothetical protein
MRNSESTFGSHGVLAEELGEGIRSQSDAELLRDHARYVDEDVGGWFAEAVHAAVYDDVGDQLSDRRAGEIGRQRHAQIEQAIGQIDLLLRHSLQKRATSSGTRTANERLGAHAAQESLPGLSEVSCGGAAEKKKRTSSIMLRRLVEQRNTRFGTSLIPPITARSTERASTCFPVKKRNLSKSIKAIDAPCGRPNQNRALARGRPLRRLLRKSSVPKIAPPPHAQMQQSK